MVSSSQDGKVIVWDAFSANKEVGLLLNELSSWFFLFEFFFNSVYNCNANNMDINLCVFSVSDFRCLRVINHPTKEKKTELLKTKAFIFSGLDNQVSLHSLNPDDDVNKTKRVVATHANYISACKFMHSDQQVSFNLINSLWLINFYYIRFSPLVVIVQRNYGILKVMYRYKHFKVIKRM